MVLVRDGIGTVETSDYQTSEDESKKVVVKYSDWATLGYVEFHPATIAVEGQASAAPSSTGG